MNKQTASLICMLLILSASAVWAASTDKPRVFITESHALQVSSAVSPGEVKGALSLTGGTSPENVDAMKVFSQRCPGAVVTANRDKADFILRLDHEAVSPMTPFVHGNKVALFNKTEDLIYSSSTRILSNAVKGACTAIMGSSGK